MVLLWDFRLDGYRGEIEELVFFVEARGVALFFRGDAPFLTDVMLFFFDEMKLLLRWEPLPFVGGFRIELLRPGVVDFRLAFR